MAWATTTEATSYVGVALTQEQVDLAQPVIDIYANITWVEDYNIDLLKSRDLHLLKLAVAYQAKWMADQIDVLNRTDVVTVNQDGMSFRASHSDSLILAPLAKRALDKVSWRKARTLSPIPNRGRNSSRYTSDDNAWCWRGM